MNPKGLVALRRDTRRPAALQRQTARGRTQIGHWQWIATPGKQAVRLCYPNTLWRLNTPAALPAACAAERNQRRRLSAAGQTRTTAAVRRHRPVEVHRRTAIAALPERIQAAQIAVVMAASTVALKVSKTVAAKVLRTAVAMGANTPVAWTGTTETVCHCRAAR